VKILLFEQEVTEWVNWRDSQAAHLTSNELRMNQCGAPPFPPFPPVITLHFCDLRTFDCSYGRD
jgi:hypothetical protein